MNQTVSWTLVGFLALAGSPMLKGQATLEAKVNNAAPAATITGPGIIALGSPIVWHPTNAPDTFSANVTFSSTPVTVDNGAVTLFQQQIPTGPSGEWDVFYMKTTNGGPLAGNIGANWNITLDYTLTAPAYFDQVVQQWLVNGTPVSPIMNGIGSICCATTSNPILTGPTYYNSGFSGALPAGVQANWQQIYVDPYNYVSSGGINPSTANEFIFALHFTLQSAMPVITGVISASEFGGFPTIAPGTFIEIYGSNLGQTDLDWSNSFSGAVGDLVAPTTLVGTSATVAGQAAFIAYVSPAQVNVLVPGGVSAASQQVVVKTEVGPSNPFSVTVNTTQPGLLAAPNFKIGGNQYVVAQLPGGTYVAPPGAISGVTSNRAMPGDTITIFGIGFGQVNEGIPPGEIAPAMTTLATPLTFSVGGISVTPSYAGLAPTYTGLYQFNVQIPNVPANDLTPITFTLGGTAGTQTLYTAVGN